MSTPENSFIDAVHKHLPTEDELHREGMHNPYRGGTADVWYSGKRDLWIEYKFIQLPKRDDTLIDLTAGKKPSLSVLQQTWLQRRCAEGRNVAVVVGFRLGPREQAGLLLFNGAWLKPFAVKRYRLLSLPPDNIADWIVNKVGTVLHAPIGSSPDRAVRNNKSRDGRVPARVNPDLDRVHGQTLITETTAHSRRTKR